MPGGTRARNNSFYANVAYIGGKLLDLTGLGDGEGFVYNLATDKFVPVPLTATGDMFADNNLSDVADITIALANLNGEPAFAKGTAFNKNFGTVAGTVAEGNHNHNSVYAAIDHDHAGTYEAANANIQVHISNTSNPHEVSLLQLADFPSVYVAGKWMKVNATADGIEFVDAPSGSGGTWGSITGTLADQTDLQNALNTKSDTGHTHTDIYEPANDNIQSHISDINKHIDWTNTNKNLVTSGYITISVAGSAHFTLEGNSISAKTIHFVGPGALGNISFAPNSPNMDFNVGTKNTLQLLFTGAVKMSEYGSGNFAGTPTYFSGWDVDGNVVEASVYTKDEIDSKFLSITNTTIFTPTADYHPATKKYVDDNAGGGGALVAIDDSTPAGTETMWYQPNKGIFSILIDSQWVNVGRNGLDGAPGVDGVDGVDGAPGADGADGTAASKPYGHFYLSGSGNTGLTSTEVTLTINATGQSYGGIMSLASNQITISKTAIFEINANVYLNNSSTSRTEYSMWLEKNGVEIAGTRFASYQRGYDSGMSSGVNTIVSVTSGDTIQIQCQRTDGSGTTGYQDANGTSITIKEL